MYYVNTEEYAFRMPQEHIAYLNFKERLRDLGVKFTETGGHSYCEIKTRESGTFEMIDGELHAK